MKKLNVLLFVLGMVFLAVLISKTGVRQLSQQLKTLGWRLIPFILAEGVAEFFHAVSWRYCFSGAHRRISLFRLFQIHMAGYAVNFLTPTASVAGEVSKGALLADNRKGAEAISAVLIGKVSFSLAHVSLVTVGTVFLLPRLQLSPWLQAALLLSGGLLAIGIVAFLIFQKQGKLGSVVRWLIARSIFPTTLQRFLEPIEQVDATLKVFYRERPWDLVLSVGWHLLGYAVGIFTTWYFLYLTANGPGFSVAVGIWFLWLWFDLVTFAVPLNLGVLEGGRIVAFRAFGFKALSGMTYGVVTRLAQLFWAGFGLLTYALLISRAKQSKESSPPIDNESDAPDEGSDRVRPNQNGREPNNKQVNLGDNVMKIGKENMLALVLATLFGAITSNSLAQTDTKDATDASEPRVAVAQTNSMKATVQDIDYEKREMTLKGAGGKTMTIGVSDEVKNFPQIKKGDEVTVNYYESVALSLGQPGEAPANSSREALLSREPGQKPGGLAVSVSQITATVEKIDREKREVTLKGPEGNVVTVKVDPSVGDLTRIKEGDQINATRTEALAVSVDTPKNK